MVGFKGKARGRLKTCFRFSDTFFVNTQAVDHFKQN